MWTSWWHSTGTAACGGSRHGCPSYASSTLTPSAPSSWPQVGHEGPRPSPEGPQGHPEVSLWLAQ